MFFQNLHLVVQKIENLEMQKLTIIILFILIVFHQFFFIIFSIMFIYFKPKLIFAKLLTEPPP